MFNREIADFAMVQELHTCLVWVIWVWDGSKNAHLVVSWFQSVLATPFTAHDLHALFLLLAC